MCSGFSKKVKGSAHNSDVQLLGTLGYILFLLEGRTNVNYFKCFHAEEYSLKLGRGRESSHLY